MQLDPDAKVIMILGRRWFDGCNTYHSVRVVWSDGSDAIDPYGYSDHYLHTAGRLIGLEYPGSTAIWRREHNIAIDVCDVKRRRDLHMEGRGKVRQRA